MQPLGDLEDLVVLVGCAALLSCIACSALLILVGLAFLWDRKHGAIAVGQQNSVLRAGARFLKTQFGVLFLNLVVSDLLQALGFVLNFHWTAIGGFDDPHSPSFLCRTQAVFIQAGDVASSFGSLLIAVHTTCILVLRFQPRMPHVFAVLACSWALVIFLAVVGPLFLQSPEKGDFYALAGGWCWIGTGYEIYRFVLHYMVIFIVSFFNVLLYSVLFLVLRYRLRAGRGKPHAWAAEYSKLDRIAKKMILYPIAYLIVVMPLSIYRLAGIAGHAWSLRALLLAGTVFTLSGLVDVALFTVTRKLIPLGCGRKKTAPISLGSSDGYRAMAPRPIGIESIKGLPRVHDPSPRKSFFEVPMDPEKTIYLRASNHVDVTPGLHEDDEAEYDMVSECDHTPTSQQKPRKPRPSMLQMENLEEKDKNELICPVTPPPNSASAGQYIWSTSLISPPPNIHSSMRGALMMFPSPSSSMTDLSSDHQQLGVGHSGLARSESEVGLVGKDSTSPSGSSPSDREEKGSK